jgi:hypothetical protein
VSEYAKKAIVIPSGRALVVKAHAIQLAKCKGDRSEVDRLEGLAASYVEGNQKELDDAGIYASRPSESEAPSKTSYSLRGGEEVRGGDLRELDKSVRLQSGAPARESEWDEQGIKCSLFIAGINGPSEQANFQLIDFLSGGAINTGAVTCGGVSRHPSGRLAGPTFIKTCSPSVRDHVWSLLEKQEAWPTLGGKMSIIVCHPSNRGVVESNPIRLTGSPIGMVWQRHLLLETPQDVIDLDDDKIRMSESRVCTWCLEEGHKAIECKLLEMHLKSLPKDKGGIYRCERCQAINQHLTKRCPRASDYGYGRSSGSSDRQPSTGDSSAFRRCKECGELGHLQRTCPKVICFKCDRRGHLAFECQNPFVCFICSGPHHSSECPSPDVRDIR